MSKREIPSSSRERSVRKCREKVISYNYKHTGTGKHKELPKRKQSSTEEEDDFDEVLIKDAVKEGGISGKQIYSFNRIKKHERIISSPQVKKTQTDPTTCPKTPFKLRKKIDKGIKKCIQENSSSEEDPYAESGSEFSSPSGESESESEANTEQSSDSDSDAISVKATPKKAMKLVTSKNSTRIQKNHDYLINTEEYFASSANKAVTSNHSLAKLKTPRLNQHELRSLLSKMKIAKHHRKPINALKDNAESNFNKWMSLLHENFNLLLYGLGTKLNLLQKFHSLMLKDLPTVVVNGFFPSLTIKDILDSIVTEMLDLSVMPTNVYEACDLIIEEFRAIPEQHVYIIVHNIDGDMLRNHKSQSILANLAGVSNIHLIATIDHINAPLIWDHNKLSKFKFVWWDVTTFLSYVDETSFESSLMVQRTGNLALSSLRNVFLSLTKNSKGIYLIILKYQLENNNNQYYQGILFKALYSTCRDTFLVSSDLALRAQLNEFVDHKMVKIRRSVDGGEYLIIPIQNNLLQQFLNENK